MQRLSTVRRCLLPRQQCLAVAVTTSPLPINYYTSYYDFLHQNPTIANHSYSVCHLTLAQKYHAFSTTSATDKPKKKKVGMFAKIRRMVRTSFGYTDDTPRGIQERKDLLWIVLAATHRKLRLENQLLQRSSSSSEKESDNLLLQQQVVWQDESKEKLKELVNEAVSQLDDKTDISDMTLQKLRGEIQQTILEPQILQLLNLAYDMEEDGMEEENDDYEFSNKEEEELYKDILLSEYNNVTQSLKEWEGKDEDDKKQRRTADPVPFYKMKQSAIETLLTYFDWLPKDTSVIKSINNTADEECIDEFGFSPNKSDPDLIPAMRYYHVRNLVRSSRVRQQPQCYHSLLTFKSTIPSAGRGVFIDGFAPAGTVLALIPGKVWPREHLQSASLQTQMQLAQDPRHQLSMRYDDILIDSRHSTYTVVKNLWAVGHIFNHPPVPDPLQSTVLESDKEDTRDGTSDDSSNDDDATSIQNPLQGPNCITCLINYSDKILNDEQRSHLEEYIPNEYEAAPKPMTASSTEGDEIIMQGMGLIAFRDVKDEELVYDYRLSPDVGKKQQQKDQYPSWYYIWDKEAMHNRWETDD